MTKKILTLVMVLAILLMVAVGCQQTSTTTTTTAGTTTAGTTTAGTTTATTTAGEKFFIGFSQCTTDSPYYVALQDAAEAAAKAAGCEFRLANANNDVQKQNQDISDLITAGMNVLILNAVDASGVAPGVQACADAGIKVITVDRPIDKGATAFVGRDNEAMGKLVGEAVVNLLGGKGKATGKILELQGAGGNMVTDARSAGFHAAFEGENVKFIQSGYCDYNRAKAVAAAQDLIQANPDIKVIYGHNDDMAIGGMQVAEEAGAKDVIVCGVDGLMEAVKLISEGKYQVTTMNDPAAQGKLAAEIAIKVAKGETVDAFIDAGTQLITKDNAASLVGDTMFATLLK